MLSSPILTRKTFLHQGIPSIWGDHRKETNVAPKNFEKIPGCWYNGIFIPEGGNVILAPLKVAYCWEGKVFITDGD